MGSWARMSTGQTLGCLGATVLLVFGALALGIVIALL